MNQVVWIVLFIGHILGDFYFQTSALAREKEASGKKLVLHCFIYLITMVGVIIPIFSWPLLKVVIGISVLHFMIDGLKFMITNCFFIHNNKDTIIFLVDQGLHILVLLAAVVYITVSNIEIDYMPGLETLSSSLGLDMKNSLSWILILLVMIRPCSVTIKKVLNHYRPTNENQIDEGIPSAGALIGIFERFFILLMLYANQFTAIGFVLTAKSIARYNKISENPQFAEYYLLGTLLSTLLIIVSYFFIF